MAVRVKLFSTLVPLSRSKQAEFEIAYRDGMTVQDIIESEGFQGRDAEAIAAVVNSAQSDCGTALHDGDQVELLVNLQGGT